MHQHLKVKELVAAAYAAVPNLPPAEAKLMREVATRLSVTFTALTESLELRKALTNERDALNLQVVNLAVDIAAFKSEAREAGMVNNLDVHIPPMTDPLGRHWQQPAAEGILIDDTFAVMDSQTYRALAEYSGSVPSGVYPGKMWKAVTQDGRKFLRWYGTVEDRNDICSCNAREILIAEAGNG